MRVYGNAFAVEAGRCFRLVYEEDTSRPMHCPGTVMTRGWWRDGSGRWWVVDSCEAHAGDLSRGRPGPGSVIGHAGASDRGRLGRGRRSGPYAATPALVAARSRLRWRVDMPPHTPKSRSSLSA